MIVNLKGNAHASTRVTGTLTIKKFFLKHFLALAAVIVAMMVVSFNGFLFESAVLRGLVGLGLSLVILIFGDIAKKVLLGKG